MSRSRRPLMVAYRSRVVRCAGRTIARRRNECRMRREREREKKKTTIITDTHTHTHTTGAKTRSQQQKRGRCSKPAFTACPVPPFTFKGRGLPRTATNVARASGAESLAQPASPAGLWPRRRPTCSHGTSPTSSGRTPGRYDRAVVCST